MYALCVVDNLKLKEEKMAQEKIKIEFKDGKKIVTSPDGKVKEYKKKEVERYKQHLVKRKQDIDQQIIRVDEDLSNIEKSKQVV